jgi:hypothetical protein
MKLAKFLTIITLATAQLFCTTFIGNAQTTKNSISINFGLSSGHGYPSHLYRENCNCIPSINLSANYSINELFSAGIYGAYTYTYFKYKNYLEPLITYEDIWKGWDIGIRGSFHFSPLIIKNKNFDLYTTAFIGGALYSLEYDKKNIYHDSLNQKFNAINIGGLLGFRYYITQVIGLYAEGGLSRKFFIGGGVTLNIPSVIANR